MFAKTVFSEKKGIIVIFVIASRSGADGPVCPEMPTSLVFVVRIESGNVFP
jgi:hypothetical protein